MCYILQIWNIHSLASQEMFQLPFYTKYCQSYKQIHFPVKIFNCQPMPDWQLPRYKFVCNLAKISRINTVQPDLYSSCFLHSQYSRIIVVRQENMIFI